MSRIPEWLNQEYPNEPPLSTIKRDGRGIHHPVTGMLLCPIRYDWEDEEYAVSSVLRSSRVNDLIGYAPSSARLTPTTIIPLIFAFGAFIVVVMDPVPILRKAFYKAYCL